jgi:hypothetical protein
MDLEVAFCAGPPGHDAGITARDRRPGHDCPESPTGLLAPCLLGRDGTGRQRPNI